MYHHSSNPHWLPYTKDNFMVARSLFVFNRPKLYWFPLPCIIPAWSSHIILKDYDFFLPQFKFLQCQKSSPLGVSYQDHIKVNGTNLSPPSTWGETDHSISQLVIALVYSNTTGYILARELLPKSNCTVEITTPNNQECAPPII